MVYVIIWFLLSLSLSPKVITLKGTWNQLKEFASVTRIYFLLLNSKFGAMQQKEVKMGYNHTWAWPKILGGRVWVKENFKGGEGSKNFRKFYCRFVIIPRGPKNFLKKWHFLAKKVKNFFKNAIFFLKFCEAKDCCEAKF